MQRNHFSADAARQAVASFDLRKLPADFYADPYPYYRALRELDPVHRMPDGSFFLSRYQDLMTVYKDTATFSSDKKKEFKPKFGDTPIYEHHTTSLVFSDPPAHTRVRRLMAAALTPRHINTMEAGLEALVDSLLDKLESRGDVDLVDDYAGAIPVEIIGNLLGVPHGQRDSLREWSLLVLGALEPVLKPEQIERASRAIVEMEHYLGKVIEDRRRNPGDPETDMLSRLIAGEDGEQLEPKELMHNCIFLLNAGHETTTNLIGNGLVALQEWPEQKARLIAEPELIKTAVEEFLRMESSNQLGNRLATRDTEIGGVNIPAQSFVTLGIGAANRDPEHFPDPDTLDIGRAPNRHLAFGSGIHQCVGMALGRLEGRVAIGRFLERFPDYSQLPGVQRGGRARFRGFLHAPARLRP
ncbi:MAG: cytochrome P450 [Burkholderiaceae bacterium]|nr:cytochrome P450 [Sulfuritalea sp.]MCF8174631.1 cytochrome P450 [Burkholderiaceae bacterium]MCF8183996.1 cytochrome P450 [Polynucleobacter sp.]